MGLRYLYHSWLSLWRKMTYKDKARDLPTECCSVRCAKYQKTAPYVHWLIGGQIEAYVNERKEAYANKAALLGLCHPEENQRITKINIHK